jgi:hypothetical protein
MVVMGLKGLSGLKLAAEMAGSEFYFKGQAPVDGTGSFEQARPRFSKIARRERDHGYRVRSGLEQDRHRERW